MEDDKELEMIRKRKMQELQRFLEVTKELSGMPDHPVTFTDPDFEERIREHPVVLVDFWAPWCGPCKMVGPIIDRLASEMHGKVLFGKVNVDENQATAQRYGVMSIPTMIIFKDGRMADRFVGAQSKASLEERLRRHIPGEE